MTMYTVRYSKKAIQDFNKVDRYTPQLIHSWIGKNLTGCENPRLHGKPFTDNLSGLWRYRIGDYRLLSTFSKFTVATIAQQCYII